jgi:hypothetical protein
MTIILPLIFPILIFVFFQRYICGPGKPAEGPVSREQPVRLRPPELQDRFLQQLRAGRQQHRRQRHCRAQRGERLERDVPLLPAGDGPAGAPPGRHLGPGGGRRGGVPDGDDHRAEEGGGAEGEEADTRAGQGEENTNLW